MILEDWTASDARYRRSEVSTFIGSGEAAWRRASAEVLLWKVGFSYRTLPGHPVDGEEAFIVYRRGEDVFLCIRSLTRAAAQQPWRLLFPVLLVAQRVVRRRYLQALSAPPRDSR